MKKFTLFIMLVMSGLLAIAQGGRIDLQDESKADIKKSDFQTLRAVFSYNALESVEVTTERGVFSEILLDGTYPSGELGAPELPATHELLAVPFGATPTVNVISYTVKDYKLSDFGIKTIKPRQPSLRKDQKPEDVKFVYNEEAYQTRSVTSAPEATIEVQGTLRGIRVGSLVVNPVSYNAKDNVIRVFNDIEVEVSFDGADIAETERMLLNTYSPYFDIVYKQMFNSRQILSVYDDHPDLMAYPVHMIVITPENYISTLQPWLNWKIQKGFDVSVHTTAQTGSTYNAIRSYVQNLYSTGVSQGKTPTFLVIVGDVAQVPARSSGTVTDKVTDLYYGTVDNDYFPDMYYSRMSAENTSQLTNIINKVLQYEQYTMPDPSYLSKVTLIAGWDDYWTSRVGAPTINYATTNYYNTAHGFTQVNSHVNQSQYSGCYNALSTGVGFVNYTAHGDNNMWYQPQFTNSNVNGLSNTNKYFLAMGNCCLTGNFGYYSTCFGEAMIRAQNKGAFTYIGSCPETYWYEDYYFGVGATNTLGTTPNINNTATGVYDAVWMDDTYNTISSMVFLGNIAVCYAYAGNYSNSSSSGCSQTYYWQAYHVLGDGSIMPYRVNPTANSVSHASTIPTGSSNFTVNAQAGSYVGISQNNELKGAALVPASGSVNVPVTNITQGQVRIVVTKPQRQPYIQDISTSGGVTTYTITASIDPTNGGTLAFGGKNEKQTFTYDFEGTYPLEGWSTIDNDGDGYGWEHNSTNGGHDGSGGMVTSASYVNYVGALTPDNFLVSPQVTLGGTFSFWACAQDNQWATEHFGVSVSTTSPSAPGAFHLLQQWDMTAKGTGAPTKMTRNGGTREQGTWHLYTVDLSEYQGHTGYIAIRHFGCTDMFMLNVDDVTIVEGTGGSTPTQDPISATFNEGAQCTLIATPNTGFNFVKWTKNGVQVSTDATYTFTVSETAEYVAHMEEATGVAEETKPIVSIYPNPVSDKLILEAEEEIKSVEIYNLTGIMVFSQEYNSNKVDMDLGALQGGVYFLKVATATSTETRRFVKKQ